MALSVKAFTTLPSSFICSCSANAFLLQAHKSPSCGQLVPRCAQQGAAILICYCKHLHVHAQLSEMVTRTVIAYSEHPCGVSCRGPRSP